MLAEAVVASYTKKESDGYHKGQLTVTGISACPYSTYLNYHHLDDEDFDPESRLRMKNGHWQELEVLEDLKRAGFKLRFTGSSQQTVHVGKSSIAGRPDGLITVTNREDLLEIKAMSLAMYTSLKKKGIDAFPSYKTQVQLYLASEELSGLKGCWFYVKHKDSCRPYDIFLERDESYVGPIIEAVDEIVLGRSKVERPEEPLELCTYCRHKLFCWKTDILDMSSIGRTLTKEEVVDKWLEAQFHLEIGKQLNEEVRVVLNEYLADMDSVFVEGKAVLLEVKKILQNRSGISEAKFVERYGAAALADVIETKLVSSMRVRRRD